MTCPKGHRVPENLIVCPTCFEDATGLASGTVAAIQHDKHMIAEHDKMTPRERVVFGFTAAMRRNRNKAVGEYDW